MPESLVDWEATRKEAETEAKHDAATLEKVHEQELTRQVMPLDIDASLEAASGVFLPPGEGLFVFDTKTIQPLTQALANSTLDKGRTLEQVLVPVPVIPSRHTITLPGAHAKLRIANTQPEFYMRTADGHEPLMELVRVRVHGYSREVENIDTTIFKQSFEKKTAMGLQRWLIATGVYRFTLAQPLEPGEYVMTEKVRGEGLSLYVWDFGVDAKATGPAAVPKSAADSSKPH